VTRIVPAVMPALLKQKSVENQKTEAKKLGLMTRKINGELYRELKAQS